MAATTAEVRAWARDQGRDVPDRGRLGPELWQDYEAALDNAVDVDLPGGDVIDLDLPELDEGAEVTPEVRPSRSRARQSTRTRSQGFLSRILAGDTKAKAKPKAKGKAPPRVSLEKLVTRGYGLAGRLLAPVSPAASMCLRVQAPMAGVMLNDIVQATVVDRLLQPVARAEEKLDVVFALMVPPVACMGLEMAAGLEQTPQTVFRIGVLQQMLRESLRTGLELSEKYGEQIAATVLREAKYDEEVNVLIATIFGVVQGQAEEPVREPEMAGAAA
jgi:hypothetical protein